MRSPLKMGSVVPSSRWLARAMVQQIDKDAPGVILELGAGTGVVTHALLLAGIAPEKLLVLEREPKLHALLVAHYPTLNTVCADAVKLDEVLKSQGITQVNAIVSSLPLLSMPRSVRRAIVQQMAAAIGNAGRIIQFTYGPKSPIGKHSQDKCHISGSKVKTVLANIPPAHVWVYTAEPA